MVSCVMDTKWFTAELAMCIRVVGRRHGILVPCPSENSSSISRVWGRLTSRSPLDALEGSRCWGTVCISVTGGVWTPASLAYHPSLTHSELYYVVWRVDHTNVLVTRRADCWRKRSCAPPARYQFFGSDHFLTLLYCKPGNDETPLPPSCYEGVHSCYADLRLVDNEAPWET